MGRFGLYPVPKDKTSIKTDDTNSPKIPVLNTLDIIGHIFLMPPQWYGQKFRVLIVKIMYYHETKLAQDPGYTQFICSVSFDKGIMSYNEIINHTSNK